MSEKAEFKETKKSKILKMFNDQDWHFISNDYACKTLTYDDFSKHGLSPTVEYQERYCDVIYARKIFVKMGYRVGIGIAFHIYDYSQKRTLTPSTNE